MLNKLKECAKSLKISDLGVVKAEFFSELCIELEKSRPTEFIKNSPKERCDPFLIMPDIKSFIVCIFSYNLPCKGNISKYAMGKDYHLVVNEKLNSLAQILKESGYKAECFSDSWCMNERYLAVSAGLGFIGKNHMFISPKWGSFVFIGAIATNCEIEHSAKLNTKCVNCGKCIKACPGKAIDNDGNFFEEKCVSFISQKKGCLNEDEKASLKKSKMIWGCDICQNVCPYNKNAPFAEIEEFTKSVIENLKFDEEMSNREFKRIYADRAFSWRGKAPILRNIKILEEEK